MLHNTKFNTLPPSKRGTNTLCKWQSMEDAYSFGASSIGFGTQRLGSGRTHESHSQ